MMIRFVGLLVLLIPSINGAAEEKADLKDKNSPAEGSDVQNVESSQDEQKNGVDLKQGLYYKDKKNLTFSLFSYPVNEEQGAPLKYPNKIEAISFDNKEVVFEKPFEFPKGETCLSVDVCLCIHREPMLVRIQLPTDQKSKSVQGKVILGYYFAYDANSKTLKNLKAKLLGYEPQEDVNGNTYFKLPEHEKATHIYDGIGKVWNKLFEKACKTHPQSTFPPGDPPVKVTIIHGEDAEEEVQEEEEVVLEGEEEQEEEPKHKAVEVEEVEKEEQVTEPAIEEEKPVSGEQEVSEEVEEEEAVVEPEEEKVEDVYEVQLDEAPSAFGLIDQWLLDGYDEYVDDTRLKLEPYYASRCGNYITYSFYIDKLQRHILRHSHVIDYISFNDSIFYFDELSDLSCYATWSLDVYTCNHDLPLLISLYNSGQYQYYARHPFTGKWTNYSLDSLKNYQHVDSRGLISYKFDTPVAQKAHTKHFPLECGELSSRFCRCGKEVNLDKRMDIPLEIRMKADESPLLLMSDSLIDYFLTKDADECTLVVDDDGTFLLNPSNAYFVNHGSVFSYYYKIDGGCPSPLMYPNVPKKLLFNGREISFNDESLLPTHRPLSLEVYTCDHNVPLLLNIKSSVENYYYGPEERTGLWVNRSMKYLWKFKKQNENNTVYYTYNPLSGFNYVYTNTLKEVNEIAIHPCVRHAKEVIDQSHEPLFQIQVKPAES